MHNRLSSEEEDDVDHEREEWLTEHHEKHEGDAHEAAKEFCTEHGSTELTTKYKRVPAPFQATNRWG